MSKKTNSKNQSKLSTKTAGKVERKIRYAVVGLGYFAQAAILPAFAHAKKNSELVALVSGDETKLKKLAKKYKVEHTYSYEEYDELLKSGLIDAVYIALPNHLHKTYIERAAHAGIDILCEKPLTANVKEAVSVLANVVKSRVKLMTAYRLHFQKANLEAIRIAQSGEIGEPRVFSSLFSMQVEEGNIRTNPEQLGGGPTHDIGIYCINAARYIFQQEPYEVFAMASPGRDERFKNIDEMMSVIMRFPDGKIASFSCSYGASDIAYYEVLGTKGSLCLDNAYEFATSMEMEISVGDKTRTKKFPKSDQVGPEISYFSDCILNNKTPEPRGYEGYLDLVIIEAILESARTNMPVQIQLKEKADKPDPGQELRSPPNPEPHLIHAEAPTH